MKAGVLGVVDGSFDAIGSTSETVTEGDHDLDRCLVIDRVFSLDTGEVAFEGRAARETLVDRARPSIDDGEITITEGTETETVSVEFAGVAGEFVVVERSAGTFAFDLIAAETETDVSRATVDLDDFFADRNGATPWKAGFFGTSEDGVRGTVHGEDLRTAYDLEGQLANSRLNQIGLSYGYEDVDLKMTATRSGYVEVYRPSAFGTNEYLAYLDREILPHVG